MNTLRSVRSHVTEVSSVLSGNVSTQNSQEDPTINTQPPSQFSSSAHAQTFDESFNLTVNSSPQHKSPPKPVETIVAQQHNYCNVTQPSIVHPQATRPLSGPARNGE